MKIYHTDYATIQEYLWSWASPEYKGQRLPAMLEGEEINFSRNIDRLLDEILGAEKWKAIIRSLADGNNTATTDVPAFDPCNPSALLLVCGSNPLSFTNWNADVRAIIQVFLHAMIYSPRGARIFGTYRETFIAVTIPELDKLDIIYADDINLRQSLGKFRPICENGHERSMRAAMDDWRVVHDEGDNETFISLMLDLAEECYRNEMIAIEEEAAIDLAETLNMQGDQDTAAKNATEDVTSVENQVL
jgi:hypothetical protein